MKIPAPAACAALMDQYAMLPNIRRHSLLVARIAEVLAVGLQHSSVVSSAPDLQLCVSGALLHDIAKTPCLEKGCRHDEAGAAICLRHGYPEIAEIVGRHVMLRDFAPDRYAQGIFQAQEIVYYADKRVRHDAIVPLEERLEYILEKYGKNDEQLHRQIRNNFSRCGQLEKTLFSFLDFPPEEVERQVDRYAADSFFPDFPEFPDVPKRSDFTG
ncbi:MAG: HD domain-containing protein [Candidatus Electrothrix sp. YB6]